jgi:4,5:9,10-diseco-3-hydroxy-5,9,17-trioxoandrosta-1(10),2-diene-4-oate hydrolase
VPADIVGRGPAARTINSEFAAAEARLWRTLHVAPVQRRVNLPRLGSAIRIQELGAGPPVLFLHGGSTCGTSWADLAIRLPGFRCLLVDRPGTGLSDPLRDTVRNLDELAALADTLVPDILDALDLASASIVATSFGGYFALRAALTAPERVGRLVIVGWTAGAPVGGLPPMMRAGTAPVLGEVLARIPTGTRTVRSIFRGIGLGRALDEGRISDEAIAAYAALLRHTPTLRNDLALGRLFLSPVRGLDPRLALSRAERGRIGVPGLFLWGEVDPFGGADVARSFVELFPDARLELVPGAGHAIWMDDPSGASDAVTAFLEV